MIKRVVVCSLLVDHKKGQLDHLQGKRYVPLALLFTHVIYVYLDTYIYNSTGILMCSYVSFIISHYVGKVLTMNFLYSQKPVGGVSIFGPQSSLFTDSMKASKVNHTICVIQWQHVFYNITCIL